MKFFRLLSSFIISIGVFIIIIAIFSWGRIYSELIKAEKFDLAQNFVPCLFSTENTTCVSMGLLVKFTGGTPYDPAIFWQGVYILIFGIVLKLIINFFKKSPTAK